jgi:toxin ParE1/3/4
MANPRRPIIWSSDALTDLSEIWGFYAGLAGTRTADKIVRDIGEKCRLIEAYPFGGRSRDEIRQGLRSIAASPYIVFYRVKEQTAEVVRVLDGRRDIDEIFADVPSNQ